ncbi:acyl-CoA dehydratase activase-related protein [Desulfitibacter alkalitolerans]|uniref:acyl-CoA dehydratase activase-related protein n=1 Tax=Desulfitibacter alkalitolerans TaxID=264641 RepID=UPI00048434F5|nr:acyl-CoA dehydratase activase-related protein [Desulfitibacter alkalitolerans]
MKIGYPATLTYYTHFLLWKSFFNSLGHEVIISPKTSKNILESGVKDTVTDACIPIKILHGHVSALIGKVDLVFIPRMVSIVKDETFCPKFLGLPEMVQYSIENVPKILSPQIELKHGFWQIYKVLKSLGQQLGATKKEVYKAIFKAMKTQFKYEKLLVSGVLPKEAIDIIAENKTAEVKEKAWGINLAILGYPYQVYDSYITVNMLENLEKMGVNIWTCEMVPHSKQKKYRNVLPKELFWYYSNIVMRSTYYYLKDKRMDGIIHVTAFGCGPDAMLDKLMELECKSHNVPYISITIDEHTGEAGILTRLEAFVDMLKIRRGFN